MDEMSGLSRSGAEGLRARPSAWQRFRKSIRHAAEIRNDSGTASLLKRVLRGGLRRIHHRTTGRLFTHLAERASFGFGADKLMALSPVPANQSWPARREVMRETVTGNFQRPIDALEIGTWFGRGSTRIWLDSLPAGSSLTLIDSWKKYVSSADKARGPASYVLMDALPHSAIVSTLKEIYRFEGAKNDISVTVVRGQSRDVLPRWRDESFDFIYLDGSHYYEDVKSDIALSKRLLKPDGAILCGDDYEKFASEALLALARENRDRDYIGLEDGSAFHPGVMLAIAEEFGAVNMKSGFWWIHRKGGRWSLD
jgi:predicted O-methyltransferase YrrM